MSVVLRSCNDREVISRTLEMLYKQSVPFHLICLDNESHDGTVEIIKNFTSNIINIPKGQYIPGRVLNLGMLHAKSEVVVFLNSDCTPVDSECLRSLLEGFSADGKTAAVFGRQLPRPDCEFLHAKDIEMVYGPDNQQSRWRHCFSMACSAVSRQAWLESGFSETLQYSEDIDWTWRKRQAGYRIGFTPEARVYHSHNYSLSQSYRRQLGEGQADAMIFEWSPWQRSLLRYSLLPLLRLILSDWKYSLRNGKFSSIFYSPLLRTYQAVGRAIGFRRGLGMKSHG